MRRKEAVNLSDGKRLGRVCDVVFTYPEGKVLGIVVPGSRGFRWGKSELFIDLKSVKKIGVDVILVEIKSAPKPEKRKRCEEYCPPPRRECEPDRRDYGEYE